MSNFIEDSINEGVRSEVKRITEEEIKLAKVKIETRLLSIVDNIALSVMKEYNIYENTNTIIIEVSKKIKE